MLEPVPAPKAAGDSLGCRTGHSEQVHHLVEGRHPQPVPVVCGRLRQRLVLDVAVEREVQVEVMGVSSTTNVACASNWEAGHRGGRPVRRSFHLIAGLLLEHPGSHSVRVRPAHGIGSASVISWLSW